MFARIQKLKGLGKESCFLWGPRQTGKSLLLKQLFPQSQYYDLLLSNEYERFNRRPALFGEEVLKISSLQYPIIIDEIQRVPELLNEVQWLMVNKNIPFVLCGSSARKLKRGGGNLLGGRAIRYELYPLVKKEIPSFDLLRALNHGLLPRHYLSNQPDKLNHSYVGDYLREEIAAEALTRNIPAFARFLEAAAFSNGEMINYQNIASDCGVSPPTVKEYFQILEDTLIGRPVPSFRKRASRRVVETSKFYFFDLGLVHFLLKRGEIVLKSELFGKAFEHYIFQELVAHSHYSEMNYPVSYWRTASQFEVDFILGQGEVAIEVKGTEEVHTKHLKGILAFQGEFKPRKSIVVSLDKKPRSMGSIEILPYQVFLDNLYEGKILS